jgi:predicted neutral ceramidase superfamily lipid hydrolase
MPMLHNLCFAVLEKLLRQHLQENHSYLIRSELEKVSVKVSFSNKASSTVTYAFSEFMTKLFEYKNNLNAFFTSMVEESTTEVRVLVHMQELLK